MAQTVEIDGVHYHTLLELPPNSHNPSPPCIVMIHALMSNHQMYDSTVPLLHSLGYSTLRYDHIGHNLTPFPDESTLSRQRADTNAVLYHMDDLTRHVHALVQARCEPLHIPLAGVMGCSIGGIMALRYDLLYPDPRLSLLSLCAPGVTAPPSNHAVWAERTKIFEADQANGTFELARQTVARWLPGETEQDELARATALEQVKTCKFEGYTIFADTIRNFDFADEIHKLGSGEGSGNRPRVLILAGEEDLSGKPEVLRELAAKIPGARFECMRDVGHVPSLHRPEAFNAIVADFLGKAE